MHSYYVYILRCADETLYTGVTNDYEERINQHQTGFDTRSYTFRRRPVKLAYIAEFGDVNEAISWEKRVKRWSRKKKEALIAGEWEDLCWYSKRKRVQLKVLHGSRADCHPEVRAEPEAERASKDKSATSP